jgi:hypothetical protein
MTFPTVNGADERNGQVRHSSVGPSSRSAPTDSSEKGPELARRLLFLDDDPARAEAFLIENPQAVWVQTVVECLDQLVQNWDEVHLDHDLGGRTFVDVNESDCGMEVIRWLCKEPRDHLRDARFFIHTHNSLAGLLMVLQMRSSGYRAEFRPFGKDPAQFLPFDHDELSVDADRPADVEVSPDRPEPQGPSSTLARLIVRLKSAWSSSRGRRA